MPVIYILYVINKYRITRRRKWVAADLIYSGSGRVFQSNKLVVYSSKSHHLGGGATGQDDPAVNPAGPSIGQYNN